MVVIYLIVAMLLLIPMWGCSDNPAENPNPKPSKQTEETH